MSKNKDMRTSEDNRKKYTIPSGANFQYRSKNAIYISPNNTIKHEMAKCVGAYMLRKWGDIRWSDEVNEQLSMLQKTILKEMKEFSIQRQDFITEAVPKDDKNRRVDLVGLKDRTHYEWETNKKVKKENAITFYL